MSYMVAPKQLGENCSNSIAWLISLKKKKSKPFFEFSAYHADQNDAHKDQHLQLHIHARQTLDLWGILLQVKYSTAEIFVKYPLNFFEAFYCR